MNRPLYPSYVYQMLETINRHFQHSANTNQISILDCGAGGETPPLGLFYEQGFLTHGIDLSSEQVNLAKSFELANQMVLNLQVGNMKDLPYLDETFDVVFEYHSMGHLRKPDIEKTLKEMQRVLKPGGLCFVGFMLEASWPIIGKHLGNGHYSLIEAGESVIHSVYTKKEALTTLSPWTILKTETLQTEHTLWNHTVTDDNWMTFYDADHSDLTSEEWLLEKTKLPQIGNYTHLYCVLKK